MRQTLCMIIAAATLAAPALAGNEIGDYRGLPQDLAAAATAYDVAQFKSDSKELQRLLGDDYWLAGVGGKNQNKAQYIASFQTPGRKTTSVSLDIHVRHVWSTGAVLGGTVDARGIDHGKRFAVRMRFADVWAKRNGRWQVTYTQIDPIF